MTKFKTVLLAATALTMIGGAAWAQSNSTYIYQGEFGGVGTLNVAVVDQTGGTNNKAGDAADNLLQNGDQNEMRITQSGSQNTVGTVPTGVEQKGLLNKLTVTQSGTQNSVKQIDQSAPSAIGLVGTHTNVLTINQAGKSGVVSVIRQEKDGDGAANKADVYQSGISNVVRNIDQFGSANHAETDQTGEGNEVTLLKQVGAGNSAKTTQSGSGGRISITQNGNDNGQQGFRLGAAGILAGLSGMDQGVASQNGDSGSTDNRINYVAAGDGNLFAFRQDGSDNSATGEQNGSDNEIAVRQASVQIPGFGSPYGSGQSINNDAVFSQNGSGNSTAIAQAGQNNRSNVNVTGDNNDAVSVQLGSSNRAKLTIQGGSTSQHNIVAAAQIGTENDASATVAGSSNNVGILQVGDSHSSKIGVQGNNNFVLTAQGGFGGTGNTATVDINGSGNNQINGFTPSAFTGEALAAANDFGTIGQFTGAFQINGLTNRNVLTPGVIAQYGEGNNVNIDVGTSGAANNNLFSTLQYGDDNKINAEINGDGNQFVAIQSGGEFANVVQNGNLNTVVVTQ
ncbi:beta strand repeat-containing protein [Tianweitania sediminis]|uniref:Curlin associated repeat protein n=1 Tax=Tianweitania sediminis TaxID=1502156 RepID=A0A8J7R7P2_9HYPH|nr:hypothetical protein [Tianweitania sediminis]MBP0441055.1 hypothetical protein [Tianweitania sediminis]